MNDKNKKALKRITDAMEQAVGDDTLSRQDLREIFDEVESWAEAQRDALDDDDRREGR